MKLSSITGLVGLFLLAGVQPLHAGPMPLPAEHFPVHSSWEITAATGVEPLPAAEPTVSARSISLADLVCESHLLAVPEYSPFEQAAIHSSRREPIDWAAIDPVLVTRPLPPPTFVLDGFVPPRRAANVRVAEPTSFVLMLLGLAGLGLLVWQKSRSDARREPCHAK